MFPRTSVLDVTQSLTSAWSEVSEATIKNCFRKVRILEKSAEAINDQDDPFKDLAAEELEETINDFREGLPDEFPEKLNAAVLLDISAELSTYGDKPSDAEILADVWGETIQEEDDTDVVYDEPSAPVSVLEVATEVFQQFFLQFT